MEGVFEEEEDWGSPLKHMLAGAIAGTVEHCGMFPLDTIKTHMQAFQVKNIALATGAVDVEPRQTAFRNSLNNILTKRGALGLFRGLNAMILGAAPAHGVYFCTYELFKGYFGGKKGDDEYHMVAYFSAGVIATMFSEAVFTPMDAVKQRLQLGIRDYRGVVDCCVKTFRTQGILRGFYAGYTSTLVMNVPYSGTYFASYELFKKTMMPDGTHSNIVNCIAGGGAGVISAAITNPLDVARTRLQTQADVSGTSERKYLNMRHAVMTLWKEEGMRGFTSGIVPRMVFHSTSAAICWATYEYMKKILSE